MRLAVWTTAAAALLLVAAAPAVDEKPLPLAVQKCAAGGLTPMALLRFCGDAIALGTLDGEKLARAHLVRARAFRALNHAGLADAEYAAALRAEPLFPAILAEEGAAAARARGWDRAIAVYDDALRMDPRLLAALDGRAEARAADGKLAGALADLDAALAIERNADRLTTRGTLRARAGDLAGAFDDLDAAAALAPDRAEPLFRRGRVAFAAGRPAAALADLAAAAARDPRDRYVAIWLAASRISAGLAPGAPREGEDLESWPGPVLALFLGRLAPEALRPPQAIVAGPRSAMLAAATACEAEFYRALWHQLRGETAAARAGFNAAIETRAVEIPEYHEAKQALARLGAF